MSKFNILYEETMNLFEMSNFFPDDTGIGGIVIWVSKKNVGHGSRVKVYRKVSKSSENFSLTLEDNPKVIGKLFVKGKTFLNIRKFVKINRQLFLDYWNGKIDTKTLVEKVKKINKKRIDESVNLFEMSDFFPSSTGLPVTIWISVKNDKIPQIKIYKDNPQTSKGFGVTISDIPETIGDVFIDDKTLKKVQEFIKINKNILMDYWDMKFSTVELVKRLKTI